MRPLKLTMSGFGPYAEAVTLELDRLGTNGIYLITGDTGAGKSMIFDAISFALYGMPSLSKRTGAMMRSQYAAPDTPTFVELTFAVGNVTATVRRNPEYTRPKARGEGVTKQKMEATLTIRNADGEIVRLLTKPKEVDACIEQELLGIDQNQFSQIAMIAQGDFERLLLSETKEKQQIFRKLFHTGDYELLENVLKEEAKALSASVDGEMGRVKTAVSSAEAPEDFPELERLLALQESAVPLREETEEVLGKLLACDEAQAAELEREDAALGDALGKAGELLGRARAREQSEALLKQAEAEREKNRGEETVLAAALEEAEKKAGEEKELLAKEAAIEAMLPAYAELSRMEGQAGDLKELIRQNAREREETSRRLKGLTERKSRAALELEQCRNAREELQELALLLEKNERSMEKVTRAQKAAETLVRALDAAAAAMNAYRKATGAAEEARGLYGLHYRAYLDAQAGILARSLTEGMPCPVCGSIHHPNPAAPAGGEILTREELEKERAALEKKEGQELSASAASAAAKAQAEHAAAEAKEAMEACGRKLEEENPAGALADVKTDSAHLREEEKDLLSRQKDAGKRAERLGELEKEAPLLEEQISAEKTKSDTLSERGVSLAGNLQEREQAVAEKRATLPFGTRQEAEGQREAYAKEREKRIRVREDLRKRMGDLREKAAALDAKIGELTKQASEVVEASGEVEERIAELQAQRSKVQGKWRALAARAGVNKSALDQAVKSFDALAGLEEELSWKKTLSDTMNGTINGREKFAFETYVQTAFFDRIIERANIRFLMMSSGQYEMKRIEEAEGKVSQSGLDLEVIDHYNGSRRSVKSLSGGETFLASLSLALGLSDEIEETAGGIRLDTLFVDEGFGSLDSESLSLVMDALLSLTEGSRLVGIISHVEELRERIERQVQVTKRREGGSTCRIVGVDQSSGAR